MACVSWYVATQVIPWLLVVGGWVYTNNTNNKRESRKELRGALDKLQRDIDDLIEITHVYYLSDVNEGKPKESQILIRFSRLSSGIQHLGEKNKSMSSADLSRKLSFFMDQITGGDFQSAARLILPHDSIKFLEIAAAGMAVQDELETLFIKMTVH